LTEFIKQYITRRLAASGCAAIVIVAVTAILFAPDATRPAPQPESYVPGLQSLEQEAGAWAAVERAEPEVGGVSFTLTANDGETFKLTFLPKGGTGEEDVSGSTQFFDVIIETPRPLTGDERLFIDRVLSKTRATEEKELVKLWPASKKRMVSFLALLLVVLTMIFHDASLIIGGRKNAQKMEGYAGNEDTAGKRKGGAGIIHHMLFAAFILLVLAVKLRDNPWEYVGSMEILFFPGDIGSAADYLKYVLGDSGLPAVFYRALLVFLVIPKSVIFIRVIVFGLAVMLLVVTYLLAARHGRGALAWAAPALLFVFPIFDYGLEDMRGYMFFTFFGMLSVYLFDKLKERPSPRTLLAASLSFILGFTANPLVVTLWAGPAVYYILVMRRKLPDGPRKLADLHFGFVAAAGIAFIPFVYRAAGSHHIVKYIQPPYFLVPYLTAFNSFCLLCTAAFIAGTYIFRRDFRGPLFLSAAAGTGLTMAILALGFLEPYDYYLLFVMPLNFVCLAVLLDALVSAAARRVQAAGRAAGVFFSAAAAVFLLVHCTIDLSQVGGHRKIEESVKVVDTFIDDRMPAGTPVYLYPHKFYIYYISHRFGIGVFDRNPMNYILPDFRIDWKELPGDNALMWSNGVYTSYPFPENPVDVFAGPFGAGVFGEYGLEKLPPPDDCVMAYARPEIDFQFRYCVTKRRGGIEDMASR